jgi:hypothetical protein
MQPSALDDIAPIIGYTATRRLVAWFPGRELHVPAKVDEAHPLVLVIGYPAFCRLVAEFPGTRLYVPTEEHERRVFRERQIAELVAAGVLATAQIAAAVGLTERRVQQILRGLRSTGLLKFAEGYKPMRVHRRGRAVQTLDDPK